MSVHVASTGVYFCVYGKNKRHSGGVKKMILIDKIMATDVNLRPISS